MASNFCQYCGSPMEDNSSFCQSCGKSQTSTPSQVASVPSQSYSAPSQSYSAPSQSYSAPSSGYTAPQPTYSSPYSAPYSGYNAMQAAKDLPLTIGQYIGMFILAGIPIVGQILILVWAFSSNTNTNKKNYARAILLIAVILGVLSALISILFAGLLPRIMNFISQL